MAFEFERDESIDEATARIAHEQFGAALAWLSVAEAAEAQDPEAADDRAGDEAWGFAVDDARVADFVRREVDSTASVEEAVHEARKCCKRVRGLVRLVRPAMEDAYQATNTATRDAARELSPIRDAHALLATFDDLVAAHADQVPTGGIADVRRALQARAQDATHAVAANRDRIDAARRQLVRARDGLEGWPLAGLDRDEQSGAVAAGVSKTADRARDAFAEVLDMPGPPPDELLHEWRKRVKYSWYHVSLVEPAAPTLLGALADLLHDLSDVLGDDHDLAILSADLREDPDGFGGEHEVEAALVLVEGTRRDLQRRAVGVGARLHAEPPDALGARLVALLRAWWRHGPEPEAGEIEDLHDQADDLGDRTNGQLRDLARQRDVPGRSRMDRAGLLGALRAAGRPD
jgi:CHAD domain-containing protein